MSPVIYHGTPMTPRDALLTVCAGRAMCVSFFRPDDVTVVEQISPLIMYDNGAFSFWRQAVKSGAEWDEADRNWQPYYDWLAQRLFEPGRWAVIPDRPGAPSQLNDGMLNDWPFGNELGVPLWHMDGPISRLGRLCDRYSRVALGWTGDPKREPVGCDAYRERMEEVATLFGNRWPSIHMMRGVAVARDYPFRQRGQHQPRAERPSIRRPLRNGRPVRRPSEVGGPDRLRKQIGETGMKYLRQFPRHEWKGPELMFAREWKGQGLTYSQIAERFGRRFTGKAVKRALQRHAA
jgi:hypothetical protein